MCLCVEILSVASSIHVWQIPCALEFPCLFVAVTPTSGFQALATIYLLLPIQGNIHEFSHRGDLTVNRTAFVSNAPTDIVWLCFPPRRCHSKKESI